MTATRAALVVALTLAAGADLAAGQGRGVPGQVVFYSARTGNNEIYVMDWDGRRPLRMTDHAASDVDPALAPDGRDIVFTSNRTGDNDIFLVGSAGGPAMNLTTHPGNDGWPRWSPDGRQVVFHSNRDGNFELYVMNRDGSGLRRLTDHPGIDQFPDWSPDGRTIAFRRDLDVHVLELRSGETRRLTDAPPLNQMPAWSPDGRRLAFMSARDGYPAVFVMDADGGGQRNLTPKGQGDADIEWVSRAPAWSDSGRHIYFMSSRPSTGLDTELFIMNADGTGVTRLTHVVGVDGSPRPR